MVRAEHCASKMLWQLKLYDATLEPFRTPLALKLAKRCDMSQKILGKKVPMVIKTQNLDANF
jgi:hypothetical protein